MSPRQRKGEPAAGTAVGPAPPPHGAYEAVARVEDLEDGRMLSAKSSQGEEICLFNHNGIIGAVSNICTHQAFPICDGSLIGRNAIQCSWHGAMFDITTGAVLEGPATDPLPVFAVHVEHGVVLVGPRKN